MTDFVNRQRLPIGWVLLLLAWLSPFLGHTLVLVLVCLSVVIMIAALIGSAGSSVMVEPLHARPKQELLLLASALATLAGVLIVPFCINRSLGLGGFLVPTNTIVLLLNSRPVSSTQ